MKPISLVLRPSYSLTALLTVASLLACISIGFAPLAPHIVLTWGMLIVFTTIYFTLRDALLLLPWSWQQAEVNDKGELTLTNSNGTRFSARVKTNSYVAIYLVILHVNEIKQIEGTKPISEIKQLKKSWFNFLGNSSSHVVLLLDSVNQQDFRQLRVWLSWWQHNHTENLG